MLRFTNMFQWKNRFACLTRVVVTMKCHGLYVKPKFDDIPFDFPSLLAKKKSGKSWMEIAREINEPSSKLGTAFTKYKSKVKDLMTGGAA
jgi:hypothetical protein